MFDLSALIYEAKVYVALFIVFTALAFLTRGKDALKWSPDLRMSAFVNVGMLHFNGLIGILFVGIYVGVKAGYEALNLPQVPKEFWDGVPTPLVWLSLLFVYDMSIYWIHRWMHNGWLWPMHAVHHSDTELHFLSWSRGHALEQIVIASFVFIGSAWLGLSIAEVFALAFVKSIHQYYVHSNIDWDHGPFKLLLASPQYHRWHHADVVEAYDKNFASIFPFIDKVFGTYYYPGTAVNVPTGFPGTPKNDFVALICYPFTEWYRMIKAKISPKSNALDPAE